MFPKQIYFFQTIGIEIDPVWFGCILGHPSHFKTFSYFANIFIKNNNKHSTVFFLNANKAILRMCVTKLPVGIFTVRQPSSMLRKFSSTEQQEFQPFQIPQCLSHTMNTEEAFVLSSLKECVRLWETPRAYIIKHLGKSDWLCGNKQRIYLTEIQ